MYSETSNFVDILICVTGGLEAEDLRMQGTMNTINSLLSQGCKG